MEHKVDKNSWVYVVVQNPGGDETIVGQEDADNNILFIPVFSDRDVAMQGITQMAKTPGQRFEIQAIIYDDLLTYARKGGFLLFFLDGGGRILAKMDSDGRPL